MWGEHDDTPPKHNFTPRKRGSPLACDKCGATASDPVHKVPRK